MVKIFSKIWVAATAILPVLAGIAHAQLPAGFTKVQVAPKAVIQNGISFAHANDGRIFVAEISGSVKAIKGDTAVTVHKVATNIDREQGLLKIIAHPSFDKNGWLYLYYLTADRDHHNIDRITVDKNGNTTEAKNVVKLPQLTNGGRHNGSGMAFGKDGYLYVGRGEDETSSWAPKWDTQRGKVLRFTEDGQPAPGNPHAATAGAGIEEKSIWARGFRNPFTLFTDPYTGRIFEGEVGGQFEEINDVTAPDASKDWNYSWGAGDGVNPGGKGATIDPAYYYKTGSIGCAVVSAVPYNSAAPSNWPLEYRNRLYINDWCQGWIRSMPLTGTTGPLDVANAASGSQMFISSGISNALGLSLGLDGALYYAAHNGKAIYKIVYGGGATLLAPKSREGGFRVLGGSLTAGRNASLLIGFEGLSPEPGQAARVEILDPEGRILHAGTIRAEGRAFRLEGYRPARAGLIICRVVWSAGGELRRSSGRMAVMP